MRKKFFFHLSICYAELHRVVLVVKNLSACRKIWKIPLKPTPVLLPEKFLGHRSLVGYSSWDCKESDMAEPLSTCRIAI